MATQPLAFFESELRDYQSTKDIAGLQQRGSMSTIGSLLHASGQGSDWFELIRGKAASKWGDGIRLSVTDFHVNRRISPFNPSLSSIESP